MSNELQQDRVVKAGDPYTRTHWENNKTPLNAANLNNIENGIEQNAKAIVKETNERKLADIAINTELDAVEKKTGFIYDRTSGKASFNLDELLPILTNKELSDLQKCEDPSTLLEKYTLSQMLIMLYTMYINEVGDMYSINSAVDGEKTYEFNISDGLENRMTEKNLISAINNFYSWVKQIIGIDDSQFQQGVANAQDKFKGIHSDLSDLKSVVAIFNKIYDYVIANKSLILANKSLIDLLNSSEDVKGSVKNTVITEIAKVVANAPEDLDTLKEIADWISSHENDASSMNSSIISNTSAINEIKNDYATKVELQEVVNKIPENIDISKLISYGTEDPDETITTQYYVKLDDSEVIIKNTEQGIVQLKYNSFTSEAEYYRDGNNVYISGLMPDTGGTLGTFSGIVELYFKDTTTKFYKPPININFRATATLAYGAVYNTNGTITKQDLTAATLPDGGSFSFQFITNDPFNN